VVVCGPVDPCQDLKMCLAIDVYSLIKLVLTISSKVALDLPAIWLLLNSLTENYTLINFKGLFYWVVKML